MGAAACEKARVHRRPPHAGRAAVNPLPGPRRQPTRAGKGKRLAAKRKRAEPGERVVSVVRHGGVEVPSPLLLRCQDVFLGVVYGAGNEFSCALFLNRRARTGLHSRRGEEPGQTAQGRQVNVDKG